MCCLPLPIDILVFVFYDKDVPGRKGNVMQEQKETLDNLMVELMGSAITIQTIAEDQQMDDRYNEGSYSQRLDSRMGVIISESQRMSDMLHKLGELPEEAGSGVQ